MNDLINEFEKLSLNIDDNKIQLLVQQFNDIDIENPDEGYINKLESNFSNLNLNNTEPIVSKFLSFIKILRKKTPCRLYTNWYIVEQQKCI